MGGPIVRTGTTPAFWQNWEKAFGKGSKSKTGAAGTAASDKKRTKSSSTAKAAAKKAKPAAKKTAKGKK